MEYGYNTIVGLKALKALNIPQESDPDCTREEIIQNFRTLKSKLNSPMTIADGILYDALKSGIDDLVDVSELAWRDPIASTVLSDDSVVVNELGQKQKRIPDYFRNITHNGLWKENESDLEKIAERILNILGEVWNNPAFETSMTRNMQSERTYITDVIMPLLRATLGDLPNAIFV
nr:12533_t:CDS:2 [Entrophospora candida]